MLRFQLAKYIPRPYLCMVLIAEGVRGRRHERKQHERNHLSVLCYQKINLSHSKVRFLKKKTISKFGSFHHSVLPFCCFIFLPVLQCYIVAYCSRPHDLVWYKHRRGIIVLINALTPESTWNLMYIHSITYESKVSWSSSHHHEDKGNDHHFKKLQIFEQILVSTFGNMQRTVWRE